MLPLPQNQSIVLKLEHLKENDSGVYECKAKQKNTDKSFSKNLTLIVRKSKFIQFLYYIMLYIPFYKVEWKLELFFFTSYHSEKLEKSTISIWLFFFKFTIDLVQLNLNNQLGYLEAHKRMQLRLPL